MNNNPVNASADPTQDLTGMDIAKMLPNATDAFDVTFTDEQDYLNFYDAVFAFRNEGDPYPYRYGSY